MSHKVIAAVVVAAGLALGGAPGIVGVAEAAPTEPGARVCMTHHAFFEGLSSYTRRHTYHGPDNRWGVDHVRCAGRWATAGVTARQTDGRASYTYTVLEHRSARGNWYELGRAKPCREHEVPSAIYERACESN